MTDFQNDKILNQMIKFERKKNYVIHNFEHLCVPADSLLPKTCALRHGSGVFLCL